MANTQAMQEAILQAVDTIVTQRNNDLQLDKTVIAIIEKNIGVKNGKPVYQVQYSGGFIEATCQNSNDIYLPKTAVYVLIPQGNFSNEKVIIGYASTTNIEDNSILAMNSQAIIGTNLLYANKNNTDLDISEINYGLRSWHNIEEETRDLTLKNHRYQIIYNKEDINFNSQIDFNEEYLNIYKTDGTGLMIKAEFQTNLSPTQKEQLKAKYGLAFTFVFNDSVLQSDDNTEDHSYEKTFILTSDEMNGNPFEFNDWTIQYSIFSNIEIEKIKYLKDITFFQEGFKQGTLNDDINEEEEHWPINFESNNEIELNEEEYKGEPDIYVKNIQIYVANNIEKQIDNYSLKVESYNNSSYIFDDNTTEIEVEAILLRGDKENLSLNSNTTFYWFKESSFINSFQNSKYNALAGLGWEQIENAPLENPRSKQILYLNNEDTFSFKNNYKCVAVYDSKINKLIISYEFSIYNKKYNTLLELSSSLGTEFSFNVGTPKIIIKLKDKDANDFKEVSVPDNIEPPYKYIWCIIDKNTKQKIFLNNIEEFDTYDLNKKILKQINLYYLSLQTRDNAEVEIPINIELKRQNGDLVEIDSEKIKEIEKATEIDYPVNLSSDGFTIICFVRKLQSNGDYQDIGSAKLNFVNIPSINIIDYWIEISNDKQIFKYDEFGNLIGEETGIPLMVTLKTPDGVIIPQRNYQWEWQFPPSNQSLIISTGQTTNSPSNCPFDVSREYNAQYSENQIKCHVYFDNRHLYKDTSFSFEKEGDSSTTGIKLIPKIELNLADEDSINQTVLAENPVTLYKYNNLSFINVKNINSFPWPEEALPQKIFGESDSLFTVSLYNGNTKVDINNSDYSVSYGLAGNKINIKYFKIENEKSTMIWEYDYVSSPESFNFLIQILRANVTSLINNKTYYTFINFPIIEYNYNPPDSVENLISIDKETYLTEIIYNAFGNIPIYDQNKGLKLNLPNNITKVICESKGGFNENNEEAEPCFKIVQDSKKGQRLEINKPEETNLDSDELENSKWNTMIYIEPDNEYNGNITNNRVEAYCYDDNDTLIATVYSPINMLLDTSRSSLIDLWDGNTIVINEDNHYIMTPQIGSGRKDQKGNFTGLLMGKLATSEDDSNLDVGLLGYSCGLQSIFLDAATGNATFGLPDGYTIQVENGISIPKKIDQNDEIIDNYKEGRIEIRPGHESKIGGWVIGKGSLYYTLQPKYDSENQPVIEEQDGHQYYSYEYSGEIYNPYQGDNNTPNNVSYTEHHKKDIGINDSGLLLSADPPYISIVGNKFTASEIEDANGFLLPDDSIELQLDPQTPSVFSIFRHNGKSRNDELHSENNQGTRTFLAGINNKGQFQANAISSATSEYYQSNISVGNVLSFDEISTNDPAYIGAAFEIGTTSETTPYFSIFVEKNSLITNNQINDENHVYITGGSTKIKDVNNNNFYINNNYYARDMSLHGNSLSFYAKNSAPSKNVEINASTIPCYTQTETDAAIQLKTDSIKFKLGNDVGLELYRNILDSNNNTNINKISTVGPLQIDSNITHIKFNNLSTLSFNNTLNITGNGNHYSYNENTGEYSISGTTLQDFIEGCLEIMNSIKRDIDG